MPAAAARRWTACLAHSPALAVSLSAAAVRASAVGEWNGSGLGGWWEDEEAPEAAAGWGGVVRGSWGWWEDEEASGAVAAELKIL